MCAFSRWLNTIGSSTENVYFVGVFVGRYGLAAAKRFNNVPAGMPVFMYQWTWDNVMAEQVWVDLGGPDRATSPGCNSDLRKRIDFRE